MDVFYESYALKTKKEKQRYFYTELNKKLGDSVLCSLNPGYYPLNPIVSEEKKIKQYYLSLYLSLLENIDTKDKVLLDLCCGRGHGVYSYKKYLQFKNIYAMDNSEIAIDFCKKQYEGITFDVMDLNNITYQNNFFDVITCVDTSLPWIVEENSEKLFNKIYEMLKNNGVFVCAEPMYGNKDLNYLKNLFGNIEIIDITQNVVDSCVEILTQIHKLDLNLIEKQYVEYSSFVNYRDYKLNNSKFVKYIFRKR